MSVLLLMNNPPRLPFPLSSDDDGQGAGEETDSLEEGEEDPEMKEYTALLSSTPFVNLPSGASATTSTPSSSHNLRRDIHSRGETPLRLTPVPLSSSTPLSSSFGELPMGHNLTMNMIGSLNTSQNNNNLPSITGIPSFPVPNWIPSTPESTAFTPPTSSQNSQKRKKSQASSTGESRGTSSFPTSSNPSPMNILQPQQQQQQPQQIQHQSSVSFPPPPEFMRFFTMSPSGSSSLSNPFFLPPPSTTPALGDPQTNPLFQNTPGSFVSRNQTLIDPFIRVPQLSPSSASTSPSQTSSQIPVSSSSSSSSRHQKKGSKKKSSSAKASPFAPSSSGVVEDPSTLMKNIISGVQSGTSMNNTTTTLTSSSSTTTMLSLQDPFPALLNNNPLLPWFSAMNNSGINPNNNNLGRGSFMDFYPGLYPGSGSPFQAGTAMDSLFQFPPQMPVQSNNPNNWTSSNPGYMPFLPPQYQPQMPHPNSNIPSSANMNAYIPNSSPNTPPTSGSSSSSSSSVGRIFQLVEQPNFRQRKSYHNEHRYLAPNPIMIAPRYDEPGSMVPKILSGRVTVKLVRKDGSELSTEKKILSDASGTLVRELDEHLTAQFALKISETSEGNMYKLFFVITFIVEGVGQCEETIVSRPFIVYSHKRKHTKEKPIVLACKPEEGPHSRPNEVWIKGSGFGERISVMFGDQPAEVIENNEHLLVVKAPALPSIMEDTQVSVVIANKFMQTLLSAENSLLYTYRFNPNSSSDRNNNNNNNSNSSSKEDNENNNKTRKKTLIKKEKGKAKGRETVEEPDDDEEDDDEIESVNM